jgi:hypothetical protein
MSEADLNKKDGHAAQSTISQDNVVCPHCGHVNPAWRSLCENCDQALREGATARSGKTPRPKKDPSGLCQKCNTAPGNPYTFYYLKRIGTGKTMRLSDYKDGGPETVALCDNCVGKHRGKELLQFGSLSLFFLVAGLVLLGFFLAVLIRSGAFSALFLASGFSLVMLGIGSSGLWRKALRGGTRFSGVSLAMDVWKKWLSEQGYATLLFEEEYAKLKARG